MCSLFSLFFSGFFVLTNGIILVVQTSLMSSPKDNAESIYMPWVTYFFVACKSDTILLTWP